jgi:hypothetical protein
MYNLAKIDPMYLENVHQFVEEAKMHARLCHKRKYLMLSILIQGPKQASIDIDVFLKSLMEDMAKLWNEGVHMWDQYQQKYFTLKAIIFVCIHNAPEGFTVSRQTKGKSGCPVCVDRTALIYLPSSRKLVFMRHLRFLERKHKYRKMKRHFDNTVKKDSALKRYTKKLLFEMVRNIQVVFGKRTIKGQKRKKTLTSTDMPFKM